MATNLKPTLFDQLRASGLLEQAKLDELGRLPEAANPDPRALGRVLLQRGLLTRFQINLVAQGRGKDLLIGPYVVLDRLGEGGMGQVYKAQHRHMHRVVALKVIRRERLRSPEAVKRFYQEVQAAAQLHHANIVLAYDAGQAGNTHYLAMEYVDGQDLARLVRENGPLPVAQACDYIRQAALGLQHAYERGMVHRDIKPHNLLVTAVPGGKAPTAGPGSWGLVKILDMGLARLQGPAEQDHALTATGTVIGTPDYLAPEQALDSRAADIRSDLYSLGCTFYYLLTGVAPFQAESLTQLLLKHQMEEAVPLEQRRPDVPAGVREVVRVLIAKRPEDRFQTPAALAAALLPCCTGGGAAVPRLPAGRQGAAADDNTWASLLDDNTSPPPGAAARTAPLVAEEDMPARARRGRGTANMPLLLALIAAGVLLPLLAAAAVGVLLFLRSSSSGPPPSSALVLTNTGPGDRTPPHPPPPPPPSQEGDQNPPPPPAPAPPLRPLRPGESRRLPAPGGAINAVAISPDGRRAVGAIGNTLVVWDLRSAAPPRRVGNHRHAIACLCFAPNGRDVFAGDYRGDVRAWDVEVEAQLRPFEGAANAVHAIAVTPDGRRLLAAGGGNAAGGRDTALHVWDVDSGNELGRFTGHPDTVERITLSPDGRRACSFSRGLLCFWDVATMQETRRLRTPRGATLAPTVSPDFRFLVFGTLNRELVLWDLNSDQEVRRFNGWASRVSALAFSPDGRRVVSGGKAIGPLDEKSPQDDSIVRLWDVNTGQEVGRLPGHLGGVTGLAFARNGQEVLSASEGGQVLLWRVPLGPRGPVAVRPGPAPGPKPPPVVKKEPVPDEADQMEAERLIKKQNKEKYARRPAERGELAAELLEKAKATNDDPAGRYVLLREARDLAAAAGDAATAITAIDQMARLYVVDDTADRKVTALTTAAKVATRPEPAKALAESALVVLEELVAAEDYKKAEQVAALAEAAARKAGQAIFSKRVEAQVKEFHDAEKDRGPAEAARAVLRRQPEDPAANLTLGKYLCFRKGDWDAGLPHLARGGDAALKEAAQVDLTRPGTAEEQKQAGDRWWDLAEQKPALGKTHLQRRAAYWYQQAVTGLAGLTLDEVQDRIKTVVEQTPDLKPAESHGEERTFTGHTARVTGIAFFPDGKQLVSGSYDGTLRLWDVQTGTEVKQLRVFRDAEVTSVATDGGYIAAGTLGGVAVLWEADPWRQITSFSVGQSNPVECVAFAGTEHRVVFGTANGDAWLWPRNIPGNNVGARRWVGVNGVGISSKGNYGLFACTDGLAHLVDLEMRKEKGVLAGHKGPVLSAALAANGKYAATASADKTARYWSVLDGRTLRQFLGHNGKVLSVAISPDGKYVATGSEDHTVRLWDPGTGREIRRFSGHEGAVNCVAFSPDGRQLVSCSDDKTVRLWELSRAAGP